MSGQHATERLGAASPQSWGRRERSLTDGSETGSPSTIEQHVRQQDVAAQRAQAELVHPPRPAVAA